MTDTIIFPAHPSMVRVARYAVAVLLADTPRREDAVQVVSEYATNAVLHSSGNTFDLLIVVNGTRARVEVGDDGPACAASRVPDEFEEYGRGLVVVDELADKWGTDFREEEGRQIWWAELSWN